MPKKRTPATHKPEATRFVKLAHTLEPETLERVEYFAYKARVSKSAIIELALRELFERGDDRVIGALRAGGNRRRRATPQ